MESQASTRTEAEMIADILAGETQLYHELIRPHERSVYLMALSYMKNEADAEDVAQEAFVRAFRNLASFRARVEIQYLAHQYHPERSQEPPSKAIRDSHGVARRTSG